jgi:uncharacterized protein
MALAGPSNFQHSKEIQMAQIIWMTIVLVLLVSPGITRAQEAASVDPVTLPATERHTLYSSSTASDYDIYVALPGSYSLSDSTTYPVVYVLDGNLLFAMLVQTHRMMRLLTQEVREAIIVGIGYPVDSNEELLALRFMDLTPTRDVAIEERFGAFLGRSVGTGGAAAFLNALTEEIIPFVGGKYRAGPERMIAGFSLGGLFGVYTLLHEPQLFQYYLIVSPSLFWDNEVAFAYEERYASDRQSLQARVVISAGALEGTLTTSVQRLAATLTQRQYPDLELTAHVFEDETHFSGIPAALSRGLRLLLSP